MRTVRVDQERVNKVLATMKQSLSEGRFSFAEERAKNMATLARLGIRWQEVKEYLEELTYHEYISGPEPDRDYPNSDKFWKFKMPIQGELVYIKLKIQYREDKTVHVVSFHIDEILEL